MRIHTNQRPRTCRHFLDAARRLSRSLSVEHSPPRPPSGRAGSQHVVPSVYRGLRQLPRLMEPLSADGRDDRRTDAVDPRQTMETTIGTPGASAGHSANLAKL
jgi:hypothetical protein